MNEKNEMPTGRITWISGTDRCRPRELAAFVAFTEKKP